MQSEQERFIAAAIVALQERNRAHQESWRMGQERQWAMDLETGMLTLTFEDGTVATAPMQIVGTYDTENGTFLWSWENPSVPESLRSAATHARAWGEANGAEFFTSPRLRCPEAAVHEFAAVAVDLSGASGAYRATNGATNIYMTFGEVTLEPERER